MRGSRALVAAVALAVVGLVLLPTARGHAAGACGSSSAKLDVYAPDGSLTVYSSSELCRAASVDAQYYTRSHAGNTPQADPYVSSGIAIEPFLQNEFSSTLHGRSISFIALEGNGYTTWTASQGAQPTYPNGSGLVPVLYYGGDGLDYARPLLDDASDVNGADDAVHGASDAPLKLFFGTGSLLSVNVTTHPANPRADQPVTFTATSSPSSPTTAYSWDFGDGHTSTGATATHTYTNTGQFTYPVTVTASDAATGSVGQQTDYVTVAAPKAHPTKPPTPPATKSPTPTPTATGTGTPPTTPPHGGSTQSPGGQSTLPPSSHPKKHGRSNGHHHKARRKPTPTLTPPPGIALPSGATRAGPPQVRAPLLAPKTRKQHKLHKVQLRLAGDTLPLVSGQLIGSSSLTNPADAALAQTAVDGSGGLSGPTQALAAGGGGVAVLVLLGAGIARELGGLRLWPGGGALRRGGAKLFRRAP